MPLSMYQESLCEFVDMEMDGAGYDEIAARLAAAFPPGLRVTAAAAPVFPVKRIKYAVYRIGIVTSLAAAEAERALAGPMPVEKRGKSGVRTLDIRPLIRDCAVAQTEDGWRSTQRWTPRVRAISTRRTSPRSSIRRRRTSACCAGDSCWPTAARFVNRKDLREAANSAIILE